MGTLKMIGHRVPMLDTRRAPLPPKKAASIYHTPEFKQWREIVIARAGGRCEHVSKGVRCSRSAPSDRMFADHIEELRDGGLPFDPENGQCLCGGHHTAKTARARAARR